MQASEREGLPDVPSGIVTFLFTDIEGSTKLLEQLREGYAAVLADQRDLLRAAFAHCSGHEIDTQGDAFFVAFPRALDALHCVIEAQQALAKHAWPNGATVRVRMGLHTGEPIVACTGYVGMDVHRAARIAAAGHGGQVLLSQTTRDLIYQDLPAVTTLRALGKYGLTGVAGAARGNECPERCGLLARRPVLCDGGLVARDHRDVCHHLGFTHRGRDSALDCRGYLSGLRRGLFARWPLRRDRDG